MSVEEAIKHKDDWFNYVNDNKEMLRMSLMKNITYDEDIFDDVTAETVIRIAENIIKGCNYIKDFKNMFFICAKRHYITVQNNKRKMNNNSDRYFFDDAINDSLNYDDEKKRYALEEDDNINEELRTVKIHKLFKLLEDELNNVFPPNEVDLFMIYFRLKSEKHGISYKKLSAIVDRNVRYITGVIMKIKRYVRSDEKILKIKEMILKDDD